MDQFIGVTNNRQFAPEALRLKPHQVEIIRQLEQTAAEDTVFAQELVDGIIDRETYLAALAAVYAEPILASSPLMSVQDRIYRTFLARIPLTESLLEEVDENKLQASASLPILMEEKLASQALASQSELRAMTPNQLERELLKLLTNTNLQVKAASHHDQLSLYANRLMAFKTVQMAFQQVAINEHKEARQLEWLTLTNDGLFTAVRQLQRYGLKSAYVRDNSQLPIIDWHVYDPHSLIRQLQPTPAPEVPSLQVSTLANFSGFYNALANRAPAAQVSDHLDLSHEQWSSGLEITYGGLVKDHPNQLVPDISCSLHRDGHLHSFFLFSLASFAADLGREAQYEILRSRALSIYADMVLPVHVVKDSPDIRTSETRAASAQRLRGSDFAELVLARQRLIDSTPDLAEQIDKQEKSQKRLISRHGVVGFIRCLPEGQRASQTQRDLCRLEQGLELAAEGETYVGEHDRGGQKPEIVTNHTRARLRYLGGSAISSSELLDE